MPVARWCLATRADDGESAARRPQRTLLGLLRDALRRRGVRGKPLLCEGGSVGCETGQAPANPVSEVPFPAPSPPPTSRPGARIGRDCIAIVLLSLVFRLLRGQERRRGGQHGCSAGAGRRPTPARGTHAERELLARVRELAELVADHLLGDLQLLVLQVGWVGREEGGPGGTSGSCVEGKAQRAAPRTTSSDDAPACRCGPQRSVWGGSERQTSVSMASLASDRAAGAEASSGQGQGRRRTPSRRG